MRWPPGGGGGGRRRRHRGARRVSSRRRSVVGRRKVGQRVRKNMRHNRLSGRNKNSSKYKKRRNRANKMEMKTKTAPSSLVIHWACLSVGLSVCHHQLLVIGQLDIYTCPRLLIWTFDREYENGQFMLLRYLFICICRRKWIFL